jgi:aminoglycoside phosphotransferase (APT) family kinase protein
MSALHEALRSLAVLLPGATVESIEPLADATGATSEKAMGYGQPLKVVLREPGGGRKAFVFRRQSPNEFGHDRRADRIEDAFLAFDTFGEVPRHVRALDVGTVGDDGRLHSLRQAGEPYLVTEWAEGSLYVEDLRRIASDGLVRPEDTARCDALARYLSTLHQGKLHDRVAWRRAVRDLLGHGEGLFGIVDAWPDEGAGIAPERLRAIEERCLAWRWRLRPLARRLSRTHGDFHPFNIVFLPGRPGEEHTHFALLDASRGGRGDPADDVTALAVNFPFLSLAAAGGAGWRGLGPLWHRFWDRYLALTGDPEVLEVAPPFWAWRCLVVASPRFYPHLPGPAREALVGMAEAALEAGRLDLDLPDRVLAGSR